MEKGGGEECSAGKWTFPLQGEGKKKRGAPAGHGRGKRSVARRSFWEGVAYGLHLRERGKEVLDYELSFPEKRKKTAQAFLISVRGKKRENCQPERTML